MEGREFYDYSWRKINDLKVLLELTSNATWSRVD